MAEEPPPYSSTTDKPPQPPSYSSEPDSQAAPPTGFQAPPAGGAQGAPQQEFVVTSTTPYPQDTPAQVVVPVVVQPQALCPICKIGVAREEFTMLGVCLAIFFFPLGFICCLLMRVTRCSYCRAIII